jgi:hypothetical protein
MANTPDPSLTDTPVTSDLLIGVAELEPTARGLQPHRLPAFARRQSTDPQVAMVEAQPAGARVSVRTTATRIELDVLRTRPMYEGVAPRPDGVYDLVVDGELCDQVTSFGGDALVMDMATGSSRTEEGPVATIAFAGLPDRDKTVEIWLPHNELTRIVALRSDRPLSRFPGSGPGGSITAVPSATGRTRPTRPAPGRSSPHTLRTSTSTTSDWAAVRCWPRSSPAR